MKVRLFYIPRLSSWPWVLDLAFPCLMTVCRSSVSTNPLEITILKLWEEWQLIMERKPTLQCTFAHRQPWNCLELLKLGIFLPGSQWDYWCENHWFGNSDLTRVLWQHWLPMSALALSRFSVKKRLLEAVSPSKLYTCNEDKQFCTRLIAITSGSSYALISNTWKRNKKAVKLLLKYN